MTAEPTTSPTQDADAGPRERLLRSARALTYEQGMSVGIDAILKDADVARRSLYQHFGSKEGLIVEMLKLTAVAEIARYRQALDAGGDDPRERLLSLFSEIEAITSASTFRGCRYTAVTLSFSDAENPAREQATGYKVDVTAMLRAEFERMGRRDADLAAAQLMLVIDGALAMGANQPGSGAGAVAKTLAELVIDRGE
jgi:AcrR family transcriptional regulator